MALELFDFKYWMINDEFPSSPTTRFGRGYTFTAKPNGPEELIFHLSFKNGLWFMQNSLDKTINATANPQTNILMLRAFYARNLMYQSFNFQHPTLGLIVCRFNKPLLMPKVATGAPGAVGAVGTMLAHQTDPFELEFLLVP